MGNCRFCNIHFDGHYNKKYCSIICRNKNETIKYNAEKFEKKQIIVDLENEIWKDVVGYEGLYRASTLGRIKSLDTPYISSNGRSYPGHSKILKYSLRSGYALVCLLRNGIKKTFSVHRIIAIAFIPNPENKKEVNHKDMNRINNIVENLEWMTGLENIRHGFLNNPNRIIAKGSYHKMSKLNEKDVIRLRELKKKKVRIGDLEKMFGIKKFQINAICNGSAWKHVPMPS